MCARSSSAGMSGTGTWLPRNEAVAAFTKHPVLIFPSLFRPPLYCIDPIALRFNMEQVDIAASQEEQYVPLGTLMNQGQGPDQGQGDGCISCDASVGEIVSKCGGAESTRTWLIVLIAIVVLLVIYLVVKNRGKDKPKSTFRTSF